MRGITIGSGQLLLVRGDITELGRHVGAIVNAASDDLRPGNGGVSAAIHRVGGMEIGVECRWIGKAAMGTAVGTTAGLLNANAVIHAIGPIWMGGRANEEKILASAYRSALELADELKLASIAFPAISAGSHGFPFERAANIAIGTTAAFLRRAEFVREALMVQFAEEDYVIYDRCLERLAKMQASRAAFSAAQQVR